MFGWLRRRIQGQVDQAVHLVDVSVNEPRALPGMLQNALLSLWGARGGGLFGLGYVVTFVALEIRTLIGNAVEVVGSSQGVMAEMAVYLLRLGYESLLNMVYAFIWPALAIDWAGSWMLWALILAFVGFEWGIRPLVEDRYPELKRRRLERAERKAEKQRRKDEKAQRKLDKKRGKRKSAPDSG